MTRKRAICIGLITEDNSDADAISELVKRIAKKGRKITTRRRVGNGCGKLVGKCRSWAADLRLRGCKYLVVVHDLDKRELNKLRQDIEKSLYPSPIEQFLICIPVEEIEAWWLSDPDAIKNALHIQSVPKVKGNPENIASPKEKIKHLVAKCSNNSVTYLNTRHNSEIARQVNIEKVKRCNSFVPFHDFIKGIG